MAAPGLDDLAGKARADAHRHTCTDEVGRSKAISLACQRKCQMIVFKPGKDPRRHCIVDRRQPEGCKVLRDFRRHLQNGQILQVKVSIADQPSEYSAPQQSCDIRFRVA